MNATARGKAKSRSKSRLQVKRVYAPATDDDGFRVLVDRLWPRGLTKQKAAVDLWLKDIAPSDDLRRRFHGHQDAWKQFVAAYRRELAREPAKTAAATLHEHAKHGAVTLLYGSRDEEHNNAIALKDWLER